MRDSTIVVFVRSAFWWARTCSTTASSSAGLVGLHVQQRVGVAGDGVRRDDAGSSPATISAMSAGFVRLRQ